MTDASQLESHGQRDELGLVLDGEDDSVGVLREIACRGLTCRVNKLRGQDPKRQVTANKSVVVEGLGGGLTGASGPVVSFGADVERSWKEAYCACRSRSSSAVSAY